MNETKDLTIQKDLKCPDWLPVVVISVVLMLIQTGFKGHAFLTDDNVLQFYPVIDKVYSCLFKSGRLPYYDFFQMKGMIIGDEGYYCQTNILMLVSWMLTKSILPWFDCLTLYGFICVVIGNIGWNALFRKMDVSRGRRLLVISLETVGSAFIWFGYWYYAFNSYIIIPFLLGAMYRMFTEEHKSDLFIPGILLFFSLTLGNVQFTVYHYMVFGVMGVVYILLRRRFDRVKLLFTNGIVGAALSAPILLSQLNASVRRNMTLGEEDFFARNIPIREWLINGMIPGWLIGRWNNVNADHSIYPFNQAFMPGLHICVLIFIVLIIKKTVCVFKEKADRNKLTASLKAADDRTIFVLCAFISILFFVLFQAGKGYGVADIFSIIPVINQFRWLYKLSLIIVPLMAVVAAYVSDRISRIWISILCLMVVLAGIHNIHVLYYNDEWMYNETMRNGTAGIYEYDQMHKELDENGVDLNNYRMLAMSSEYGIFGKDHFDARLITANYPTMFGMYSLGGYEMAAMKKAFDSVSYFYLAMGFDFGFTGQVKACMMLQKDENGDYLRPELIPLVLNHAVRYFLFRDDVQEQYQFLEMVNWAYGEYEPKMIQLSNGFRVYEMENAVKLCEGAELLPNENIDQLTFHVNEDYAGPYLSIKFTKNDGLKAYAIKDGVKKELMLYEDTQGDMAILMEDALRGADIVIRYGNTGDHVLLFYGMIGSLISLIAVLANALVKTLGRERKGSGDPVEMK